MVSKSQHHDPRSQIEQRICHLTANVFGSAALRFRVAVADHLGMNLTDLECLSALLAGGGMNQGQLAEHLGLSASGITMVVDRLAAAGLVHRAREGVDRRKVLVTLLSNSKLERALAGAFVRLEKSMQSVTTLYDESQLETLADFLGRTAELLQRAASQLREQ